MTNRGAKLTQKERLEIRSLATRATTAEEWQKVADLARAYAEPEVSALRGPDVMDFAIVDWHATPDGSGPAVATAIIITVDGMDLVCRLKSADAVDRVVAALLESKARVFGGADAPGGKPGAKLS